MSSPLEGVQITARVRNESDDVLEYHVSFDQLEHRTVEKAALSIAARALNTCQVSVERRVPPEELDENASNFVYDIRAAH